MLYGLGGILIILLIFTPTLWVKFVMWRHSKDLEDMPGTGGELAEHLVERFKLEGVTVISGEQDANFYRPGDKLISLSPNLYKGKSLTAIAVAAHEVGHSIQFSKEEPVSKLRGKYLGGAFVIRRLGAAILLFAPVLFAVLKIPHIFLFSIGVGIVTLIASALMYVAVLPEEYDASFNKALPILNEGYVPEQYLPAVRQILQAAALTYFAAALADSIRLWQLLRYIR